MLQRLLLTLLLMLAMPLHAAPKADLWPHWQQNTPQSELLIDHSDWQKWLTTYVVTDPSGYNRVAYSRVTNADKALLSNYLNYLQSLTISHYAQEEQMAFWINLYNAQTVALILEYYPVKSITDIDISPGFFSNGPWKKKLLSIEGQSLSLDDIEHRILRPIWQDPRIHYAVNCASVGCPNLSDQAFTAENTEQLLDKNARLYINHPRGVYIDNEKLILSKIYSWFSEDFGRSDQDIIQHIAMFADPALKQQLEKHTRIDDYEYDWSLNEIRDASQ